MTQVFSAAAMDTPALSPAWTVQNSATGSNQSLTGGSGPVSALAAASLVAHQTAVPASTATAVGAPTAATVTGVTGTDAGNLAKQSELATLTTAVNLLAKKSDLDAVLAKVNALNAALVTAGLES